MWVKFQQCSPSSDFWMGWGLLVDCDKYAHGQTLTTIAKLFTCGLILSLGDRYGNLRVLVDLAFKILEGGGYCCQSLGSKIFTGLYRRFPDEMKSACQNNHDKCIPFLNNSIATIALHCAVRLLQSRSNHSTQALYYSCRREQSFLAHLRLPRPSRRILPPASALEFDLTAIA